MANGIHHAKQIVVDEAKGYVKKLQNGSAGDPVTQGRATALQLKMMIPIYEANLRTVEDCEDLRKGCQGRIVKTKNPIKLKVGPFAFEGAVTPALLMSLPNIATCLGGFFALGKWQNWW